MASDFTPRRVVCLQPSATVTLEALDKLDRVVACTRYCRDVCPAVVDQGCAIVADSWTASTTQITALHPDLVIASVPYQEKAVSEILKSGARFLGLAPSSLDDIYLDIAAIAGIMTVPERGLEVVGAMQHEIESVRATTAGRAKPRVYCEEWGKPLIRSQRWVAELVEAAGGEFLGTPGSHTTTEAVLAEEPEVIIAAWCGAGDRVPLEKIIQQRAWQQTQAARGRRVYCISDELLNTPAPTLLRGLHALAAAINPHLFSAPAGLRSISAN